MCRSTPPPSTYVAKRTMEANRRRDTAPERLLRSILHARGHRYRVDLPLLLSDGRVRPDMVFSRAKVAVFVDGCFWHRCPTHATHPKANAGYWNEKFEKNVARDRANDDALRSAGWKVVRIWEHEEPTTAVHRVEQALQESCASQAQLESPR